MGEELRSLEERERRLKQAQPQVPEPPRLHPGSAEPYRRKIADLRASLNDDALKVEAAERLRALLSAIRKILDNGRLRSSWSASLVRYWRWGCWNAKKPQRWGWGFIDLVCLIWLRG
ncbi:hypothetical protein [Georhizobium sp. MAB10]|uniref:hypothetical protein n=1 Tax=Georhizobium sp. MAB10 TaxID=3028319 RepID=UPI0038558190